MSEWSCWAGWRRPPAALREIVLGVTVAVTMAEFVEIQQLAVEDLRKRFALAPSCQPSLTASAADPGASKVTLAIECRSEAPAPAPVDSGRSGVSRSARPAPGGSCRGGRARAVFSDRPGRAPAGRARAEEPLARRSGRQRRSAQGSDAPGRGSGTAGRKR